MIVAMQQVEVIGHRDDLDTTLALLQADPIAEVVVPTGAQSADQVNPALRVELEQTERLLVRLAELTDDTRPRTGESRSSEDAERAGGELLALVSAMDALDEQAAQLRAEQEEVRSTVDLLDGLSALVPELASLTDAELTELNLATVVLLLDDPQGRVVSLLHQQLRTRLGDLYLLVTTADAERDDRRDRAVGCLLVLPRTELAEVERVLGTDRIARVTVPEPYVGRSLRGTVAAMRDRLAELPAQLAAIRQRLLTLLAPAQGSLQALRHRLAAEIERAEAAACADLSERTFAVRLWMPRHQITMLANRLAAAIPTLVVAPLTRARTVGQPPILLQQSRPAWRPYERLVGFLSWPSPKGIDPSGLMGAFLPFLFGVMVGDIVYGLILAALGWWATRRFTARPVIVDAGRILVAGGIWATIFGVLFGEALGSLGNSLGLPALWFYRGGPAALEPLLLFALALGAAHILLGLVLGIWSAIRTRQRSLVMDRAGTLAVLVGLFVVVGVLASLLPSGLLTPAVALVVVGLVVASISHGALGLLLGPLELLGTLGNVLSYLRVAAVGLASVYLANVANELAANAPLVLGLLVAALLHLLNLALAAFSPTVQALRLHYVEFFSKFHDGGGRPFRPLGANLPPAPVAVDPDAAATSAQARTPAQAAANA